MIESCAKASLQSEKTWHRRRQRRAGERQEQEGKAEGGRGGQQQGAGQGRGLGRAQGRAQGTGHTAQGTLGHRAQGTGQRAQGRGHRAEGTGRAGRQRAEGREGRGQRAEGRGQRTERAEGAEGRGGRGQRAEGREQRAEGRGQRGRGRRFGWFPHQAAGAEKERLALVAGIGATRTAAGALSRLTIFSAGASKSESSIGNTASDLRALGGEDGGSPGEKERTSAYAKTYQDSYRIVSKAVRREQGQGRELRDKAWTSWMTNPHAWYRHPILRMLVPWIITLLDRSLGPQVKGDYNVPMQGHALGLLAFWAAPTAGLKVLRLGLTLISWIFAGIDLRLITLGAVGRQFIVGLVFKRWIKLSAFHGSEPLLCVVFLLAGCCMFGGALFYNVVAPEDPLDGTSNDIFLIFGAKTEQYRHVNQCWQSLSLLVDVLTILTVTDICLQEPAWGDSVRYPHFLASVKELWTRKHGGWVRVVVAWIIFSISAVTIIWTVFSTGPEEGQIRAPVILGGSDEIVRNIGAGVLVFVDLLVTAQDRDIG
eukprot:s3680_g5.t5